MRIVKLTISRDILLPRAGGNANLPAIVRDFTPSRSDKQATIAAIRYKMLPHTSGYVSHADGKLCKAILAASKNNERMYVHVQERSGDVKYSGEVCQIHIYSDGGYAIGSGEAADQFADIMHTVSMVNAVAGDMYPLRTFGQDHMFEVDIRNTLKRYMSSCTAPLFRGAHLFGADSHEFNALSRIIIPNIADNLTRGSIKFNVIDLRNDEENRKQVSASISQDMMRDLDSLLEKMSMPGPNYRQLEKELGEIETRVAIADEVIGNHIGGIGVTCNVQFEKAYDRISELYLKTKGDN